MEAGVDPLDAAERALVEAERGPTSWQRRSRRRARRPRRRSPTLSPASCTGSAWATASSGWSSASASSARPAATPFRSSSARTPGSFAPAAETASGGELSRIALALRAVAHASAGEPTIVFDEIDAGIGGTTAHAVADALARLAGSAQLLTITHLPQIASAADAHFRVEKVPGDPTHTQIERLSDDERREELERMLGGAEFLSTVRRS